MSGSELVVRMEGERLTYAIGDVHGRLDLLTEAFAMIIEDAGDRGADVVCLGDYVDRGPDSADVIALLMKGAPREGDTLVCLMGNHEDLMIGSVSGDQSALNCWIGNGGVATLKSYPDGVVDEAHVEWMASLPTIHTDDHRVYVHAGLMPGYTEVEQVPEWSLWIRDRFLAANPEWSKHVVHGHTPCWAGKPDPAVAETLDHRTNLDTGAYATGVLTVGVFDNTIAGGPIRLLQVRAHEAGQ